MNLCIDWGNTRVKFAIFDGENLVKGFNCTAEEALVGIMDVVKTYSPERAIFSSVAQHPPELPVLLAEHTNLITLSSSTALPIINAYHSSETLGADRIALAVAAHHLYANASTLVISMGTAITYNFTQRTGTFRGGNITPGVHMRLQALHDYTQKLPSVSFDGDTLLLGYDTETSIRGGVHFGVLAEIDGMINFYKEQYNDLIVVLTGGNASLFANKIKNKIFADSELLLKGLNIILRHNVR